MSENPHPRDLRAMSEMLIRYRKAGGSIEGFGVNVCMIEHAALLDALVAKGFLTMAEYRAALDKRMAEQMAEQKDAPPR